MVRWTFLHGIYSHVELMLQDHGGTEDDVHQSVHVGNFLLVMRPGDGNTFRSGTLRTYRPLYSTSCL